VAALTAFVFFAAGAVVAAGCAEGTVEFDGSGASTASSGTGATSPGGGGAGGATTSSGSGGSGGTSPCAIDCTQIQAPECQVAQCNAQSGQCEVIPDADGAACDDGLFCTVEDTCQAGQCEGGPQNDCALQPGACDDVVCDESAQSCSTTPKVNGSACTDPSDLCQVNTTCQNGLCIGDAKDCFFSPVPDDCHVSQCNPQNGQCEPVPGNEGQPCVDLNDLCTVNKTCAAGVCQGGGLKDCSGLTQGCVLGVCDTQTGQCTTQGVNDGDPCDDLDSCTNGEICQNGSCAGGTPITQCVGGDSCCPQGCTETTDADCSCNTNLALSATGASSGGGSNSTGYGPANWNDGVDEAGCQLAGCSQCFGWVSNATSPSGAWMEYDWPSPVQIGSMVVDANPCTGGGCSNGGRTLFSGEVQWWNGSSWVGVQSFSNNDGDIQMTFSPKLTTSKLRIYDITAGAGCGQQSNTLVYEWYVYPGSNCTP